MAQEHTLRRQQACGKIGAQAGATVAVEVGGTLESWIQKTLSQTIAPYGEPAESDAQWTMEDSAYCSPGLADN